MARSTATLVLLALAACATRPAAAPEPVAASAAGASRYDIAYTLAVPDPASHLFHVTIDVGGIRGDTLLFQQPVWSPGRYAPMYFARNVRDIRFTAAGGDTLAWDKIDGSLWRVHTHGASRVRATYTVFANTLSGTFSVADTAHVNYNGASLFWYVVGHKPDPVRLTVEAPAGWMLMSGAADDARQRQFTFADYDHLIDTPTEIAPRIAVDSFTVDGRLYRVMVHHNGDMYRLMPRFVADIRKIVETENRVIAPPPLQRYTFVFNIGYAGGDGMEHLYSTEIINAPPWSDTARVLSGVTTAAHEYFHTWNVKRIRPIALGPFDYTREQYQPSLWVAEGWTQYYGDMTLERAGIVDRDALYHTLAGVIRYNSELPARKNMSARMASFNAPFWDGAATPMAVDRNDTFISYYFKGEALALLLDLKIRAASNGTKSLDDVLRRLKQLSWDQPNASYYLQGRGYTEQDVERAASDVYGADLHDWFHRYVGGVEDLPFAETLALAGMTLQVTDTGGTRQYALVEDPGATPAQRRIRDGWLAGAAASATPAGTGGRR